MVLFGAVMAGLLGGPAAPEPAPDRFDLTWDAPSGCATEAALREAIDAQLQGAPPRSEVRVRAIATVRRRADERFELRLRVRTGEHAEDRELVANTCAELSSITAVVVAVSVDPGAAPPDPVEAEPPDPEPEAEPAPTVAEPAPASPPMPEPPSPGPQPTVQGFVGAGGGVRLGPLPSPAGAVDVRGGVRWRWLRADVGVGHAFARGINAQGVEVGRLAMTTVAARLCGAPRAGRWGFPLCAGIEAGAMHGRGRNLGLPRRGVLPWLAPLVAAGGRFEVHRAIVLGFDATLLVPAIRPGFSVEGLGLLHRAPAWGVGGLLMVEANFGSRN